MSYLVVTSRCPISHESHGGKESVKRNVGGVATALARAMKQEGGTWVAWGDGSLDHKYKEEDFEGYRISRVMLSAPERKGFYEDYANGSLWPLFHYFRRRIKLSQSGFRHYMEVNKKFADAVVKHVKPGMRIWIHDYQLALVPKMLRDNGIKNLIIFTWHIPWVASEFFATLPNAREVLEGMAASDMITFHTNLYKRNFLDSYKDLLGAGIEHKLFSFSLGIDDKYYKNLGKGSGIELKKNRTFVFSIDRLDYTKGLVNRVLAIESMLREHPEDARRFTYVLAVTPSRASVPEYASMKSELEMTVGRVNGLHSDVSWQPIVYMYRKISDKRLVSYYKSADIALITPLIDGLNLVSKEFVAASEHGILILSQFAGASYDLDGALKVNPNDIEAMGEMIHKAMSIPKKEADYRLERMKENVTHRNLDWWLSKIKETADRIENGNRVHGRRSR